MGGTGVGGSGGVGGSPISDGGPDSPPFKEPDCPDVEPPPPVIECDPFASQTGCRFDQGCYPFVEYPTGRCSSERFGTLCLVAGTAKQGEGCEDRSCAPGFLCVVGSAPGARCVELCDVFGDNRCPPGLVCEPIDIQQGFGGCI